MGNKLLIGIIILLLVFMGLWFFLGREKADDAMMGTESFMMDEDVMEKESVMTKEESATNEDKVMSEDDAMEKEDAMMEGKEEVMVDENKGSYETYDSAKLAKAKDGKVVLFFRASWCPSCRALDADIKKNVENIPMGVTILDVNYDTANDLKAKYGITYQHTLVQVDQNGNEIAKWIGSSALSEVVSKLN